MLQQRTQRRDRRTCSSTVVPSPSASRRLRRSQCSPRRNTSTTPEGFQNASSVATAGRQRLASLVAPPHLCCARAHARSGRGCATDCLSG
jgi:hypothetical protein